MSETNKPSLERATTEKLNSLNHSELQADDSHPTTSTFTTPDPASIVEFITIINSSGTADVTSSGDSTSADASSFAFDDGGAGAAAGTD